MAEDKGLEKIIERNGRTIYKIAYVYMKNEFDADDVYQEVLFRYLRYKPVFKNVEHEKNWFVVATVNVCKSMKTSAWKRHNVTVDDVSWEQIYDRISNNLSYQDNSVIEALMQLEDDTRLIMQMYYYEGYSVKEIALMMQIRESAVYMRLSRGRKKMGKLLSKD